MVEQVLEALTLRERLRDAERLSRELADHLERGMVPKLQQLRRLSRMGKEVEAQSPEGPVTDATIRTNVDAVLNSHEYLVDMSRKLDRYLHSVEQEIMRIVTGSEAGSSTVRRS